MADECDHAKEWQDRHNDESLALALVIAQKVNRVGTTHCVDCEQRIAKARREAVPHAIRCAECQEDSDKRNSGARL